MSSALTQRDNHSTKLDKYIELDQLDKIWFLSDTHFWHTNIIKYCDRPYTTVEEMNQALLDNWKRDVRQDDIVIHGGDVMFGGPAKVPTMNEYLSYLPGYKILVEGNHDFFRDRKTRINLAFDEFFETLDFRVDDMYFTVTHYPQDLILLDKQNKYNIHGHTHTNNVENSNRHTNICVEQQEYKPRRLTELLFG